MRRPRFSLKVILITQYVLCALLPLVVISAVLISSFRNIQIDEQIEKQQAIADSVMQGARFALERAELSLVQTSRDTNVALAGQSALFGYSAANALNEHVNSHHFVAAAVLIDNQGNIVEAYPEDALLLDVYPLKQRELLDPHSAAHGANIDVISHPQFAMQLRRFTRPHSVNTEDETGILVISAPLYVSETEVLDSRSSHTGTLVSLVLFSDLAKLIYQRSGNLLLDSISIGSSAIDVYQDIMPQDSIRTTASMLVPLSDIAVEARFYRTEDDALSAVDGLTLEYTVYTSAAMLVFILLGWLFVRLELKPIEQLNAIVAQFGSGDFSAHNKRFRFVEIDRVAVLLEHMASNIKEFQQNLERKVQLRTEELENAVIDVKKVNRELIRTQNQLVESEKMSQIGVLVAGVAHEVNTPIGVCVTATSILEERLAALKKAYANNNISRKDLDDFIENASNCVDILTKNTERAAELIQSFKAVSVDQSSDRKREIQLHDYLELIVRSLQKDIERHQISVNFSGNTHQRIETYPGALSQIISNLILNSIKHGFSGTDIKHRAISIDVTLSQSEELSIVFSDNGKGVKPENLPKLFEPFYTTSRQSGGSGLGLSIVYNLATQRLGGKIRCFNPQDSGLSIAITFPVRHLEQLAS
ncbi:sensor histidine kinase [Alteromonas oceanisediminis]|uniref:sensor histidine kinase n=1 Tax=Alteromonas oceanisediminis TaxID=2836180 RepID=UPI001BDA0ED6|nr:HAMP domain-containing sensor histidine kinase [Alteromonas oceanisediminis]MBT0587840.1 HAMP domain-containing histidine kinase [Alteromonas oceanisediminis]